MLYYSELVGKTVRCDHEAVGVLKDLMFASSETSPVISKLVISSPSKRIHILQADSIKRVNHELYTNTRSFVEAGPHDLSVGKNLLDRQIIDIGGRKVVRVNDVVLQQQAIKNAYSLSILGVDIGFVGILRRLKVDKTINKLALKINKPIESKFLSWGDIQSLELSGGQIILRSEFEKLNKVPPEDLADYLEHTTVRNVRHFMNALTPSQAAEVLNQLDITYQTALVEGWEKERIAQLLNNMDAEECVDILLMLPKTKRLEIIPLVDPEKQNDIQYLLQFTRTSVGRFMSSQFLKIDPRATVKQVLSQIRTETLDFSELPVVYVVNKENQLIGLFSLHELLVQDTSTQVYTFMVQTMIEVSLHTPIEMVIKKMLNYGLHSLPVIDNKRHMLGIITFDEISHTILDRLK